MAVDPDMSGSAAVQLEGGDASQRAALLPPRDEIAAAVRAERLRIDVVRMRALCPWIAVLHLGHAGVFAALGRGPSEAVTAWRHDLVAVHLASSVLAAIVWAALPTPAEAHRRRAWLPTALAGIYAVDGALIATIDQRVTTAITPYVLTALAVALVLRLGALRATLAQALGVLVFVVGQRWMQPDAAVRLSSYVNAISVAGLAIGLAFVLDRALARDVRQRLRLERQHAALEEAYGQVRELAGEAAAASQAKSRFLAHVSHEIRTPMNSILGLCSLLDGELVAPKQRAWLESIDGSCRLLEKLLEDVLDLSRIEAGHVRIEPMPCDVVRVIEQIAVGFEARAAQKGLALRRSVEVPAPLLLDEARLRQIVFNLIGNAIKFTDSGSVTIDVRATPTDGLPAYELAIEVRDTGRGVAEADRGRVFEAFEQVRPAGSAGVGVGLGLAIVRGLVHEMGGTITLESELGRGSAFRVEFPRVARVVAERVSLAPVAALPEPPVEPPSPAASAAASGPAPSVEERRLLGRVVRPRLAEWRRYQRLDHAGAIASALEEIARSTGGEATAALAGALALAVESVDVSAIDRLTAELEALAADAEDGGELGTTKRAEGTVS